MQTERCSETPGSILCQFRPRKTRPLQQRCCSSLWEGAPAKLTTDLSVRVAQSSAELRAAASLRAAAFADDSIARSDFALQSHRRMKADEEWGILERKIAGTEAGWENIRVQCLVACADDVGEDALLTAAKDAMDASCKLPAGYDSPWPQLVLATLDINQGYNLPGESLVGERPTGAAAHLWRAYLANICSNKAVRRKGFVKQLINAAVIESRSIGVEWLYVHAAVTNTAAVSLYSTSCGFTKEQEEAENDARLQRRPRRLLFRKALHD